MERSYVFTARLLHWLIAACVLVALIAGLMLKYHLIPQPIRHAVTLLHISFGLTVLMLMIARIAVRFTNTPPPLPAAIPALERHLAALGHLAVYAALVAMPIIGIFFRQAQGAAVQWFYLFSLPTFVEKNQPVGDLFSSFHFWGAWILIVLIVTHIAAVVHHHRSGVPVLFRMWRNKI